MKIFISRELAPDSIFSQLLTPTGAEIVGYSLIELSEIPIVELPKTQWLFFYSKNAIDYFAKRAKEQILNYKIACLGEATAAKLADYQTKADFVGTGQAETTAPDLVERVKNESICFIQAQNSLQSVEKLTENELNHSKLIIYKNTPKTEFENPQADILVFTSPLNVENYLNKYPILTKQKVVAIGQTTAQKCYEKQISDVYIPEKPAEKQLAEKILQILSKK